MMDRDRRTRTGARAPGVERQKPFERKCFSAPRPPAQNGDRTRKAGSTKGEGKLIDARAASHGKALSDQPALIGRVEQGAGCPIMWTTLYFTPCLIPSFPACEPNSTNCE